MKYFKYYLLLAAVVSYLTPLTAQNDYSYYNAEYYSPQLSDFIRFDNASSVSLNSGRIDLSIPLVKYQDNDFELPISLQYNSSGFKPTSPDSYVGLNWSLIAGGVIYREVNGIADDCVGVATNTSEYTDGFLSSNVGINGNSIYNNPQDFVAYQFFSGINVFKNTSIEASSDIYHFNFGRHNGKFIINFDKSIAVASKDGGSYKVDISQYTRHTPLQTANSSVIKITADNGYVYHFGGGYGAMEYMAASWQNEAATWTTRNDHITAYYLSKIVAPNGREVNIYYRNPIHHDYHRNPSELLANIQNAINQKYYHNYLLNVSRTTKDNISKLFFTLNKIALIDHIVVDDEIINFYYSDKVENINSNLGSPYAEQFVAKCGVKLDSIVRKNNLTGKRFESAGLHYNYTHKRMFLKAVNNKKSGNYEFDYNSFPYQDLTTSNIDHWGFLGNKISNPTHMHPIAEMERFIDPEDGSPYIMDSQDIVYLDENREPTGLNYEDALLNKITYPTGGYTTYDYEPHYYRRYIDRKKANDYYQKLYDVSYTDANSQQVTKKIAGGARVKSVSDYTKLGASPKITSYQYVETKANPRSSGILMHKHRYAFIFKISPDINGMTYFTTYSDVVDNIFSSASDHVLYSSVLEYTPKKTNSENDSLIVVGISPLDNIRQRELYLSVGELDEREKFATWEILGFGAGQAEDATITIKHLNSNHQTVYSFGDRAEYTIRPFHDLPRGMYKITLAAQPKANIRFRAFYPVGDVEEIDSEYKRTAFSDYFLYPDFGPVSKIYGNEGAISNIDDRLFAANYKRQPNIFYPDLGLILSEEYYDRDNNLKKVISYNYDKKIYTEGIVAYTPANVNGNIGIGTRFGTFSYVNKHAFYSMLPIEKRSVDIIGSNSIETKENYTYNNCGYLSDRWIWDSEGKKNGMRYYYLSDLEDEDFVEHNFQSSLVEKVSYIDNHINSIVQNRYSLRPNLNNSSQILVNDKTLSGRSFSELQTDREVLRTDKYGNPIHIRDKESKESVILWGYNGQYPIAHIENSSYQQVASALDLIPEDISSVLNPNYTLINSLRSALPDAMITISEYELSIGLQSRTDANEVTTYYEYDNVGRLKQIYFMENGVKKILEENRYHISNSGS